MDNARHPVAHLRLDQQHHPPVALRDDRLLHHLGPLETPQVALHDLVQPVLRLPGLAPQPSQQRAGIVQHLARRADGCADRPVQVSQLRDVAGQAGQQRQVLPPVQFVAVMARRPREGPDIVQFIAPQQSAQQRPLDQLADVLLRPELQRPPAVDVPAGLRRLLLPRRHL